MAVKLGIRLRKSELSDMYSGQSINKKGEPVMLFNGKRQIDYDERLRRLRERKYGITDSSENKLEYFRKLILEHLDTLEKEDTEQLKKALSYAESMVKGGMSVGTVRVWNGKKYKKLAPGKWRPVYESESRGAKLAIAAIRRKIIAAKDGHEMMDIILENRPRFSDANGQPLPFVQELSTYIEQMKEGKEQTTGIIQEINEEAREQLFEKINDFAVHVQKKEFTREEYNKLFPRGIVKTPIGNVKLGEHQFEKLEQKGRSNLLEEMYQTLSDPIVVLEDTKDGKQAQLYVKSFIDDKNKEKITKIVSVVVDVEGQPVSISTGERKDKQVIAKIKTASRILYEKERATGQTIGTVSNTAVAQQELLSGKAGEKSSDKYKKINPVSESIEKQGEVSDVGERSTISRSDNPNPAASISARSDNSTIPQTPEKASVESADFRKIREMYATAQSVTGDEDEIQVGKELIAGAWKLVEAETPAASHDETTFRKTGGFPVNSDGSTVNDRDYEHDKAAQEAVIAIASDFDGRALKFDSPVVVTQDGIVISGNNRTMSSKLAAKKGTDGQYIEALKKRAKKFGFTSEQIGQFKNPRVIFEIKNDDGYTTEQFAKFNQSGKKEMGPTEKAVKVSKLIRAETVKAVADKISEFETLGEMYADKGAVQSVFASFKAASLIGENEIGKYLEGEAITEDGKTFIETALLGSVMNESNIRGFNRPGCKSIRAILVRSLTPLIENKGLNGYSINTELNEAVNIAMQVAVNKDKFKSVDDFSRQQNMFEKLDPVAVALAKKLEGTQKGFAEFMQKMNGGLKYSATGEADIFLGGVESKGAILERFLNIKKSVFAVLHSIPLTHLVKSLLNLEEKTA